MFDNRITVFLEGLSLSLLSDIVAEIKELSPPMKKAGSNFFCGHYLAPAIEVEISKL